MQEDAIRLEGVAYTDSIERLANLHAEAYVDADLESSKIESWNIEFLRPGEMMTFTELSRARDVVMAMNAKIGKPFFKVLVDSAHCGDSGEDISETQELFAQMIDEGIVDTFHASVEETRQHVSSDKGMRAALLRVAIERGIKRIVDEVFNPEDDVTE